MIWQQYVTISLAALGVAPLLFSNSPVLERIITFAAIICGQLVLYSGGWYNVH